MPILKDRFHGIFKSDNLAAGLFPQFEANEVCFFHVIEIAEDISEVEIWCQDDIKYGKAVIPTSYLDRVYKKLDSNTEKILFGPKGSIFK